MIGEFILEVQGWFDIYKSINIINHINKINDKKSYDHLNRCKKQFDKIQYHFMKKTLNKMKIEGIKVQQNKGHLGQARN